MNYKLIFYYLGHILRVISVFLLLPFIVGLVYGEYSSIWTFAVAIGIFLGAGLTLTLALRPEKKKLRSKEGLVIVGLSWIVISLLGALPFVLDGCIPNYLDALFETVSGFTTTGATILSQIEGMPRCMLFWRSFTHWLGGMGILVFILAIMPGTDGTTFHLFRFESPGPQVGKLASKVRHTATILYLFYFVFTLLETVLLLCGGVDLFDSVTIALSTAGTGGFANYGSSIAHFDSLYVEIVVMAFMFIFSLNFNLYYLLLLRHFKAVFTDGELRFYLGYVFLAIAAVVVNLTVCMQYSFGTALREAAFSVLSLTSTTGFVTTDYTAWPQSAQTVLLFCMLVGACAGSTGGGLKVSRFLIVCKASASHLAEVLRPQGVHVVKLSGKRLEEEEVNGVVRYFSIYILIFLAAFFLVSAEGMGFTASYSSVLSCLNNAGLFLAPASMGGAFAGYAAFSPLSKIAFMVLMLAGRLEIFPILLLFVPKTWSKNY